MASAFTLKDICVARRAAALGLSRLLQTALRKYAAVLREKSVVQCSLPVPVWRSDALMLITIALHAMSYTAAVSPQRLLLQPSLQQNTAGLKHLVEQQAHSADYRPSSRRCHAL